MMKKFAFILITAGMSNIAITQVTNSFFVFHCDPGYASNYYFNKLRQMLDSAHAHHVPITLELSPQWVDMILADTNKFNELKTWQQQGDEIGAHHHGIYHCFWDSLTNYPADSIALHQPAGIACDSGVFIGNMQPFWNKLDSVAGDSLLLTWGASDAFPAVDMYPYVPYRTDGGRKAYMAFSTPYQATHQTSIDTINYGPYTTCQIDYCFIDNVDTVQSIMALYNDTSFSGNYSTVGAVTHVFDFAASPAYYYLWLNFISGKGNKTVRQILKEAGCFPNGFNKENRINNFSVNVYPNPTANQVSISLFADHWPVSYSVFNSLGQVVEQNSTLSPQFSIGTYGWTGDIYYLILTDSEGKTIRKKIIKQ